MKIVNFASIDKKWQKEWEKAKVFEASEEAKKEKYYLLEMYAYPSGSGLHMGHAFNYTIGDILARFMRMNGKSVLHPVGYDSFGLPAENAAIKEGVHPMKYTNDSIKRFMLQQKALGLSYDWSRVLWSHNPEYYKWNQYFFLQFLKKGLAYRKNSSVNWCSKCDTVLANEQVVDEKCWRHKDTNVVLKPLEQWFFKTTKYAEELLREIDSLDWPERIKAMQKNWIGKSEGAEIMFEIPYSKETNFVLLHGSGSSPERYPWLEKELKSRGYRVQSPTLAHSDKTRANEKEDMESLWKQVKFDEDSVVIGYSLGAIVALKAIEELNHKVKKLVLVAGFSEPKFKRKSSPLDYNWKFDFKKIKENCGSIAILHDLNDPYIFTEQAHKLHDSLGGELVNVNAQGAHFTGETEPSVLENSLNFTPVFTTRADTLFGVTFLVISAQHTRLNELVTNEQKKDVDTFLRKIKSTKQEDMDKLEKEGVFTGSYAIHPLTGKKIPIWAGNFVVADYGSGMVMAVPAHDERDFEFAKKYGLEIKPVILKMSEESYSFVMGVDENEIKGIGANIIEKTKNGFFKIKIPFNKLESYKDFIRKNMIPNFWNEFSIKNGFYFIFKHKNGRTEEFELNEKTNNIIDEYGMTFNGKRPKNVPENVYAWLAENEFYKELLIHQDQGVLINSGDFNGLTSEEAKEHILKTLESKKLGRFVTQYKLRDWLISRQRYWGTPIPIIYCNNCGIVPVPEKDLPVLLPEKVKFGEGNPLLTNEKFIKVKCSGCGKEARRETDTMDTFMDSSWYYLRFTDPGNSKMPLSPDAMSYWMPIDFYVGGAEHACGHLMYARFITKALRDLGYLTFSEPFKRLFNQGMVHGEDGVVMSKSRGNVVDPLDISNKYGADTLRLFLVSIASPDKDSSWSANGVESMHKFVQRIFAYGKNAKFGKSSTRIQHKVNKAVIEISREIEGLGYNMAVIKLRALFDSFEDGIDKADFATYLQLLSPFAPHIAEELWHSFIDSKNLISISNWPVADESKIDGSIDKAEESFEKTVSDVQNILKIVKEKEGKTGSHVYLYVIPSELKLFDSPTLKKRLNVEVSVFAVNDKKKYDPQSKSGKAKPGKPGIYVE